MSTDDAPAAAAAAAPVVDAQAKKALQRSVAAAVSKLKKKAGGKAAAAAKEERRTPPWRSMTKRLRRNRTTLRSSPARMLRRSALAHKTPAELDAYHAARVFSGMTFLLSREVPHASLEFVILCGGGKVESERGLSAAEVASTRFTHQIVDRPVIAGTKQSSREYVQPQWVYDSFNSYNPVPVASYQPGRVPPAALVSVRQGGGGG